MIWNPEVHLNIIIHNVCANITKFLVLPHSYIGAHLKTKSVE